jgi:hypothetical protein
MDWVSCESDERWIECLGDLSRYSMAIEEDDPWVGHVTCLEPLLVGMSDDICISCLGNLGRIAWLSEMKRAERSRDAP